MMDIRRSTDRWRPLLLTALLLAASALVATGCQTADAGTSKVSAMGQTKEPAGKEPVPESADTPAEAADRAPKVAGLEEATCRPGADYRTVTLDEDDPAVCKDICEKQMNCMAFTYRAGSSPGEKATCHLKRWITDKVTDKPECVSWVNPRAERRLGQLREQGFELKTRRPGADFRDFAMDRAEPQQCQEACSNLKDCQAFTYVHPGYEGDKAHCYLKKAAPEPVADQECCISGLK